MHVNITYNELPRHILHWLMLLAWLASTNLAGGTTMYLLYGNQDNFLNQEEQYLFTNKQALCPLSQCCYLGFISKKHN